MTLKIRNHFPAILFLLLTFTIFAFCSNVEAQKKLDSEILITIERHPGWFGPYYSAQIYGDGTVLYEGKAGVQGKGKRRYKISIDKVKELVEEFQRINYFSLKDKYESNIDDVGSTVTSISIDGKQKKVVNEVDHKELENLENKIDEVAGLTKFIIPDSIRMRLDYLFTALNKAPTAKGVIINYGTKREVAKREAEMKKGIKFRGHDINRVEFVRRIKNRGIKTEFRIVNGEKTTSF